MTQLAKPMQFYYVPPDILNFPTQNKQLAQEFNFSAEMFKFFSKTVNLAFDGKRLAGDQDQNTHDVGGWKITDEWYQALNEYEIPDNLAQMIAGNDAYNRTQDAKWKNAVANGTIKKNTDLIDHHDLTGWNKGDWGFSGGNWVSGFVHFSNGLDPNGTDYFWGENVGSSLSNVDFDAQANEWNHLEKKKPLGLAGALIDSSVPLAKDANLDADVEQGYFINDFLSACGYNWSSVNNVLDKFPGQSYYEIVMNGAVGRNSYKNLSADEQVLLIAAMIESRNRAYSICEKVLGPAASTWNDQQMMANLDAWLASHPGQGASHGINAFRILMENSHLMLNQIYQYSKTTDYNDAGYSNSMLDRYAFWQYNQDSGAKYFNEYNPDNRDYYRSSERGAGDQWRRPGDGSDAARGAVFNFIESQVPGALGNSAIRDYLMKPLSYFSLSSRVSDMPEPPQGASPKLKAMKWLIEQWFGASNRVTPGYNSVPKPLSLKAFADYDHGPDGANQASNDRPGGYNNGYTEMNIDGRTVMVPNSISNQANSAQSYGWDRMGGPWDDRGENAFWDTDNKSIEKSNQYMSIYNTLSSWYGLAYMAPNVNNGGDHNTYVRKQFSGLNRDEIIGKAGNTAPYLNSWAVYEEGLLWLKGERTDKIRLNLYTFMDQAGTRRYKRANERYQEKKEDNRYEEAQEEKLSQKIASTHRSEQRRAEQQTAVSAQKNRKQAQSAGKKGPKKAAKKA